MVLVYIKFGDQCQNFQSGKLKSLPNIQRVYIYGRPYLAM